jgi:cephalosporin hydroxylase
MGVQERITRFTDLANEDSLSAFMGHTAQQSHFAYEAFYNFLQDVKPKRILEIGTALGGFTQFLSIATKELGLGTELLSYDISERPWYSDMIESGIDVRVEDIFLDNWTSIVPYVENFIKSEGVTVVLCDGGWKIGEFNLLSKYIKQGDYILAHDYADTKDNFEKNIKNKIWNWHEICDNDIDDACKDNNLIPYNKEAFDGAVWVCRKKI